MQGCKMRRRSRSWRTKRRLRTKDCKSRRLKQRDWKLRGRKSKQLRLKDRQIWLKLRD